ncbi:MAG: ferredoxin [Candidatus Gastranaerophilales bacterium]|nr:ferredoxin [Candidatus Gastranaerophilales bacterium]
MKVEILPGCIACGACEAINGEVFIINEIAHVIEENITGNEDDCVTAADACPVNVIKVIED